MANAYNQIHMMNYIFLKRRTKNIASLRDFAYSLCITTDILSLTGHAAYK
jgi:hypothetical protein